VSGGVLTDRALNRATLARQLLLRRSTDMLPFAAVEHLVGMQAQLPLNPYLGLWSRLEGFDPDSLSQLMLDRKVVRIVVMRGTLHLVSADDCLLLRPLAQPVLDREIVHHSEYGPTLAGIDLDPVLAFARPLLAKGPLTGAELRAALQQRFPVYNPAALAFACRNRLAIVQVPPRGIWGRNAQIRTTTAESWLGRPLVTRPSIDDVIVRYLGAFGPASVADMSAWSGLTGMRQVAERLRPRLTTFRDERGKELFDLPDAPRPDADTPAPPRFLPEYDNVLLSHAERTRVAPDPIRKRLSGGPAPVRGSVLYDGFLFGTWHTDNGTLAVTHVGRLPKRASTALAEEGRRMLRFIAAESPKRDVRFVELD
jgi:hypothetical protein